MRLSRASVSPTRAAHALAHCYHRHHQRQWSRFVRNGVLVPGPTGEVVVDIPLASLGLIPCQLSIEGLGTSCALLRASFEVFRNKHLHPSAKSGVVWCPSSCIMKEHGQRAYTELRANRRDSPGECERTSSYSGRR